MKFYIHDYYPNPLGDDGQVVELMVFFSHEKLANDGDETFSVLIATPIGFMNYYHKMLNMLPDEKLLMTKDILVRRIDEENVRRAFNYIKENIHEFQKEMEYKYPG